MAVAVAVLAKVIVAPGLTLVGLVPAEKAELVQRAANDAATPIQQPPPTSRSAPISRPGIIRRLDIILSSTRARHAPLPRFWIRSIACYAPLTWKRTPSA